MLRAFLLLAQPPLLFQEGNTLVLPIHSHLHRPPLAKTSQFGLWLLTMRGHKIKIRTERKIDGGPQSCGPPFGIEAQVGHRRPGHVLTRMLWAFFIWARFCR